MTPDPAAPEYRLLAEIVSHAVPPYCDNSLSLRDAELIVASPPHTGAPGDGATLSFSSADKLRRCQLGRQNHHNFVGMASDRL
jgi:hypothetical protein